LIIVLQRRREKLQRTIADFQPRIQEIDVKIAWVEGEIVGFDRAQAILATAFRQSSRARAAICAVRGACKSPAWPIPGPPTRSPRVLAIEPRQACNALDYLRSRGAINTTDHGFTKGRERAAMSTR